MAADLASQANAPRTLVWPTNPSDITAEWLAAEVDQRVGSRDLDSRLEVLTELESFARSEAQSLMVGAGEQMIRAVADELAQWLTTVTATVNALGAEVHTASDAINADKVKPWKTLASSVTQYQSIRSAQTGLYAMLSWPFDSLAVGGGAPHSPTHNSTAAAHDEARLYFHRNLDAVAPGWKSPDASMPWPNDPVERIIWCIRHDTGIWCPTPAQVNSLIAGEQVPGPRGKGNAGPALPRKYDSEGHSRQRDQSAHGLGQPSPEPDPDPDLAPLVTENRWGKT
ncbi:MAG: hypothetical protein PGN27_16850 [Mycolicibacterium neoaurum]|uniref:hypothetical protein n=1 Tax=Mycolicibacterium neoaurum TaxID=1795 RepID=UPI002FF7E114